MASQDLPTHRRFFSNGIGGVAYQPSMYRNLLLVKLLVRGRSHLKLLLLCTEYPVGSASLSSLSRLVRIVGSSYLG